VLFYTYPFILSLTSLLILPYNIMVELAAASSWSAYLALSYLAPAMVYALGIVTVYEYLVRIYNS